MSSDDDEEDGLSLKGLSPRPPRSRQRTLLGKFTITSRRKSTGQEFLHSKLLPSANPVVADPDSQVRRVTRSQSNAQVHAFKAQWADALVSQEPMQSSLIQLRQTVEAYEKQASNEKWGELWRVRADVTELDTLARAALDKHKSQNTPFKGLERFSTVALEYSKLLDVVMNQCPEYVALAWGVTKLLLVVNINHSRLKQNVESHLISIGEQLGLVNQLIAYSPTDKMVEAVASLYASFSKFLGKALRCYAKSKLASVIEAFAFPWEAKFQKVVSQIDAKIRTIQELASVSHFHATLCNQSLLRYLYDRHQERESSQQESGSEQLGMEIKEEMKRDIYGLLQDFNTRWVQRFDELLLQQTAQYAERDNTGRPDPVDLNVRLALPVSMPPVYLADYVSSLETVLEFRNESFPQLQLFDQRENYIRAGSRLLTTYDWQHCVALLRHPSMRSWMSTEKSGILWVDTYQSHKLDWASVFSTRIADECARLDSSMVLAHFCQGHSTGNAGSTAAILIQSLISNSISLHRERFTVRTVELTRQRFQEAQNDLDQLWSLFLGVLGLAAKGKCVWIIIDYVDILQKETNAIALLRNLNALTDDLTMTVKILITARIRDTVRLSTTISEARILAGRHAIITVPRGHHRNEATLLKKSWKKVSRLPEPNTYPEIPTSLVSVETLLSKSDSDSDYLEETKSKVKHKAKRKPETATARKEIDADTGESDSASLFDPIASSDDSEPETRSNKAAPHSYSSEDSADENFAQKEPFGDFAKVKWDSTDVGGSDPDPPRTPRIVVPSVEQYSPGRGTHSDRVDEETQAQPNQPTPTAADFGPASQLQDGPLSENDSDDAFV